MASNYTRRLTIWINGKEVKNDINSIQNEMKKLVNEQRRMIRGSEEYIKAGKELKSLNGIIKQHHMDLKAAAGGWNGLSKAAEKFNKYFAMFTAGAASVAGLVLGMRAAVDVYNEFEQSVASLSAITGLSGNDLKWMADKAKELSVTTTESGVRITKSATDIVEGFKLMGSARPELLKNKDALAQVTEKALILAAAAGIEMAPAVDAVAASMNQFNLDASQSDRIINAIAAGSLEGSAEVADLTESMKNVGTVANDSNMSLEQTVAALEVLGEKQLKGAEAGTKLRGALLKMKDAGVGYASGQFVVRDALIEVNNQINSHSSALEKDAIKQKVFGIENITAGNVLLQNIDKYDKLTVAVTGTNVAFDQAKTATATNAASLEQAKNRVQLLTLEFGEKLAPAMTFSTNTFAYFMKGIMAAIPFITQHARLITTVAAGLITYGIASKAVSVWESIRLMQIKQSIILSNLQAVAIRLQILFTNEVSFAQKRALVSTKALNAATASTPWGAIAAVVVMATMAIVNWVKESSKASRAQEAINKSRERSVEMLMEEKSKVDVLLNIINSENVSLAAKKKAIEDLQKIVPGYTAMLDKQGKVIFQNTENVKEYINQLRKQFIFEATKEEFGKVALEQAKAQERVDELAAKYSGMKGPDSNQSTGSTFAPGTTTIKTAKGSMKAELDDAKKDLATATVAMDILNNKLESSSNAMADIEPKIKSETIQMLALSKAITSGIGTKEETKQLEEQLSIHTALRNKYINQKKGTMPGSESTSTTTTTTGGLPPKLTKEEADKAAKATEDAYKQQIDIKKQAEARSIALLQEGFDKELALLQEKYESEKETINHELNLNDLNKTLSIDQEKLLEKSLLDLKTKYEMDEKALSEKQALDKLKADKVLLDLALEGVKAGSLEEYQLKKQLLDNQMKIDIASATGTEAYKQEQIRLIKEKYLIKQAKEDEDFALSAISKSFFAQASALDKAKTAELDVLKQKRASGEISQNEYNRKLLEINGRYTQDSLLLAVKEAQGKLDILTAAGEDTAQAQAALDEAKLKAQEAGTAKETDKNKGTGFKDMTRDEKKSYAIDQAGTIADTIFQIEKEKNQRILDEKLSALEKERTAELSNKNLTEAQKDAINKKYDAKTRAIKAAAWKKQHNADMIQAVVSTALAVIKAAPVVPLMIAAGVAGAASLATIAGQKPPEFFVGGYTSTSSNNKKPAGIVHDNEYVVPAEGVNNPQLRPLLDTIEMARQSGNLPRLNPAVHNTGFGGFGAGGSTSNTGIGNASRFNQGSQSSAPDMSAAMHRFADAVEGLQKNGVRGNWSLWDLEKIQQDKANIQSSTQM